MLAAIHFKRERDNQPIKRTKNLPNFKVGNLVFLKNHKKQNWGTKYMPNFDTCKVINGRAYDIKGPYWSSYMCHCSRYSAINAY